jgi:hypothetical protein
VSSHGDVALVWPSQNKRDRVWANFPGAIMQDFDEAAEMRTLDVGKQVSHRNIRPRGLNVYAG